MDQPTDPYAQIRKDTPNDYEVLIRFVEDVLTKPVFMWSVVRLPGGSRVLMHFEEPAILYSGDTDEFYTNPSNLGVLNDFINIPTNPKKYPKDGLWDEYNRLMFLNRLGGVHEKQADDSSIRTFYS